MRRWRCRTMSGPADVGNYVHGIAVGRPGPRKVRRRRGKKKIRPVGRCALLRQIVVKPPLAGRPCRVVLCPPLLSRHVFRVRGVVEIPEGNQSARPALWWTLSKKNTRPRKPDCHSESSNGSEPAGPGPESGGNPLVGTSTGANLRALFFSSLSFPSIFFCRPT